jgi:methylenetetrahydrofolate dehydrogenase (NADP+) / methenyltetrahydrofolate cyclohydrolase
VSTAVIIDGKAFAAQLRLRVAAAVENFVALTAHKPGLAVVLVGEDPASQVYVGSKKKATVAAGMNSFEHRLPASVSQGELRCRRRWHIGATALATAYRR